MAEDAPAWLAARLDLMLRQDDSLKQEQELKKTVKWCREACLTMQQMLSQRAFSEFVEKPASPGNAFNNLLEASQAGDGSHTERVTQYLLAKCRDERTEPAAQNHVWAALSIGLVDHFFMQQLRCGITAQQGTEEGLSLTKALLTLSWGNLDAGELTASHGLLMDCVKKIDNSRLLTDSDKTRIKRNCLTVTPPQFHPFWPFHKDPLYYDEALLAMYSMPQAEPEETKQEGAPDSPPQNPQRSADTDEQDEPSPGRLPRMRPDGEKSPQEEAPAPTSPPDTQPGTNDEGNPQDAGDETPPPIGPGDTQPPAADEEQPKSADDEKPKEPSEPPPPLDKSDDDHHDDQVPSPPAEPEAKPEPEPPQKLDHHDDQVPSPPAEPEAKPEPEPSRKPRMVPIPVPLPKPEQDEPSKPTEPPSPRVAPPPQQPEDQPSLAPPPQQPEDQPSPPSNEKPKKSPVVVFPDPKRKGEEESSKGDETPKIPPVSPKALPRRIRIGSATSRGTSEGESQPAPIQRRASDYYKRQPQVGPSARPVYLYGHRVMITSKPPTLNAQVHHYEQKRGNASN
ncbi:hypothetical protein Emag_004646 [Eimeria magna]